MNIIAADVGGTKTRLVYASAEQPDRILYEARYDSTGFNGFMPLLAAFIEAIDRPDPGVDVLLLALPGPVDGDNVGLTNLPWIVSRAQIQDYFGIENVYFMNDFQAAALGVEHMTAADRVEINAGVHRSEATRVVVGAGTGLGLAWLQGSGVRTLACPTEGGHIDFAPVDERQIALLQFLMQRHGHVSYERILSGDGLVTLYEFCSGQAVGAIDAARVSGEALNKNSSAQKAVQLFVQIYGSYIGNVAMLFKPEGGIYITGGIAPKIIDWMQSADFINAYLNKGRMRSLVKKISVNVVVNERVGVIGALSHAVNRQKVVNNDN